jgi:hypothetical protein
MKKSHLLFSIFLVVILSGSLPAAGWGEKGHNTIAYIAEARLSRKADREVTRLLEGHNMAYWSSWADGLRDDERYDHLASWHYANADAGLTYATAPKDPDGDVYTAVELCIDKLGEKGQSDSLKSLYLKLLIHFVGDMHCPMHAGHPGDRGGNSIVVDFLGAESNLHRLWDSGLINAAHSWSALEWALNIDRRMSRAERREVTVGTPLDWMEQTVAVSHTLYLDTASGEPLRWDYVRKYTPLVEKKLMEAGHRLASLLNEIFGC